MRLERANTIICNPPGDEHGKYNVKEKGNAK